jgi:radical SAM superfamily enzyme YgiQ (UPF0313 family)
MEALRVLLFSTYELGRQPLGLASPAAWLRAAGHDVTCVDVSRTPLAMETLRVAGLVAFHVPMHTATRLALPVIRRARVENTAATLVAYGLYAPPNAGLLREAGVDAIVGPEGEAELVRLAAGEPATGGGLASAGASWRPQWRVPDRSDLPPLDRYARLRLGGGAARTVAYTEASRGCRHWCRHCPIVPIYSGRFRVVPVEVVVEDVSQQVAAGATHVTFGDPDFLNGPRHAMAVVETIAARFSDLTYDVTIKVEHLVGHAPLLDRLRDTGCVLVTSAFESFDDHVLRRLDKGHTADDAARAVDLCRAAGLALAPTFVAFTPWTSRPGYCHMLDRIAALDLVEHVAPIQLALRLLIPSGSLLLELEDVRRVTREFDPGLLAHPWVHEDTVVDALQREVEALVSTRAQGPRAAVFAEVAALAASVAPGSRIASVPPPLPSRAAIPYLDEPWYC